MTAPACWSWTPPAEPLADRDALRDWHAGRCAVCGTEVRVRTFGVLRGKPALQEDHDHDTGLTRGFLCDRCNVREAITTDPVFDAYRSRPPAVICDVEIPYYLHTQMLRRSERARRRAPLDPVHTR